MIDRGEEEGLAAFRGDLRIAPCFTQLL